LNRGLEGTQKLPGVTDSYVYVGSWKSMFCWHKEDMDLNAINYLHDGAKKFWYSIDMDSSKDFEKYAASLWPDKYK
jgi:jumonji domain-containing protein 2